MASKLAWFKFVPSAWLNDPGLRQCSLAARGLWIDLLCRMHEYEEPGVLKINDVALTKEAIAPGPKELAAFRELIKFRVIRKRDNDGAYYSKRMVEDVAHRKKLSNAGRKAGTTQKYTADTWLRNELGLLFTKKIHDAWCEWVTQCHKLGHPMTDLSAKKAVNIIRRIGNDRAIEAIDHSIAGRYQGLFEPGKGARRESPARPKAGPNKYPA